MEAAYNPQDLEKKWYPRWIDNGLFQRDVDPSKEPYAIVIPPPNVTGILHMGHVLNNTIQDVLIRRAKQKNKSTLWVPGTDHAGISLQVRVEKELVKVGKSKNSMSREEFLSYACEWRDKHGGTILEQLKKIGVSCDWSLLKHTLDEDYSRAVRTVFVKLFQDGNIYKGKRIINWCPASMTALSDEEVIMKQQKSFLYYIKYKLVEDPQKYVIVATTRPETIMGDVAIAVNPEDERYKHLIGLHCWVPFAERSVPVIADEAVLKDFGTGMLKVTPAHDAVDFEIGKRHNLPIISVLEKNGKLNELAGPFLFGLDRFEGREKAVRMLRDFGHLEKQEPYINNVGFSERSGVPVEPRLSEQWFLKYPKIKEAKEVVKEGLIKFYPERWTKTYMHWLDNIKDWCISRQLWWGHRIPVWYKKGEDRHDPQNWHVSVDGPEDPENWEQDEDVLDTWFSSAIWPLGIFGWPDKEAMIRNNFDYFYPTADLVTGPDIIFFWVARMIISGLNLLGSDLPKETLSVEDMKRRIPFKNVYFTGIIRDSLGRKMSKSLGNSPDPVQLIERFGADGVRLGLLLMAPEGQDILFSEERLAQGKKFCTKLWNSFRFRQMRGELGDNHSLDAICSRINVEELETADLAILGELRFTMQQFQSAMDSYEFNHAIQILCGFFWGYYCDWYIEVSKARDSKTVLAVHDIVLRQILLMFHPVIPFITEELWHEQGYGSDFIGRVLLKNPEEFEKTLAQHGVILQEQARSEVEQIRRLIAALRGQKAQFGLAASKNIKFYFRTDEEGQKRLTKYQNIIEHLLQTKYCIYTQEHLQMPAVVVDSIVAYIDITEEMDIAAERKRLVSEMERLLTMIESNKAQLSDERFLSRAPEEIVGRTRRLLKENEDKYRELHSMLMKISSL